MATKPTRSKLRVVVVESGIPIGLPRAVGKKMAYP